MFSDQFKKLCDLKLGILTQKLCYIAKHEKGARANVFPPQPKFRQKCFDFSNELAYCKVFTLEKLVLRIMSFKNINKIDKDQNKKSSLKEVTKFSQLLKQSQ